MPLAPDNKRSQALTDLLSSRPGWVVRYGLSVVLLVLVVCGIGTRFIQYPDIVHVETSVRQTTVSEFNCEMIIGKEHLHKLRPGTQTRIRVYDALGRSSNVMTGRIASVSKIPAKDFYSMKLVISNESLTDADKEILLKSAPAARAQLITANTRLSDRLLSQARQFLK